MTEKQYHVQKIYKGMIGGVKIHDWCVMKDDTVILRLSTRMDCKDVVEVLNELADENEMIRNTINEMYKNERTQLGKSVLKQLLEAIQ